MSFKLLIKSLLRRKLVTALLLLQLAVTLALIVNSSLLALHAQELLNKPTGLDLDNTLVVELRPTLNALSEEPLLSDMAERQLAGVRLIPGVEAAAFASQVPMFTFGNNSALEDLDNRERSHIDNVPATIASPDIFAALHLQLLAGELPTRLDPVIDFATTDLSTIDIKARQMVITESVAKRLFGEQQAIGRFTSNGRVVAVVSDFYGQRSNTETYNMFTIEHLLPGGAPYNIVLRTAPGQAKFVREAVRENLIATESNVDITAVKSLRERKNELYSRERGLAILLASLSLLMLLVAMISAYSNAFFHALKQHQEIGIKRALGADKSIILRELFSEAWLTCSLGCALGVLVSVILNHALASVLAIPNVPLWLPLLTLGILVLCVTLASWYPAKMAVNISPVTATKSL